MRVLIIFLFYPSVSIAANILFLETLASPSHHIWIKTLLVALADKGHNVTSISADFESKKIPNLHYIHMDNVYDVIFNKSNVDYGPDIDFMMWKTWNPFRQYFMFFNYYSQVTTGVLKSSAYKELLSCSDDTKFDLIMHDYIAGPALLTLVEKFGNPPLIGATGFYGAGFTSASTGSILTPSFVQYAYVHTDLSTFYGRLINHLLVWLDYFVREYYIVPKINQSIKKDFGMLSDVREIEKRTKLILLNKHPAIDVVEPLLPNVIPVGGLQIQPSGALSEDFQEILNEAKDGVILFSLGTKAQSSLLGEGRITEILEAFRSFHRYTILWKFEAETLSLPLPPNVVIRRWIPQRDILAHPNVKLFITHCGILSIQEATYYGVPILGLPVFGDQTLNIKISVKAGVAEEGDILNIKRNSFRALMEKLLMDPKYRENGRIRSRAFRDQKETPLERAVWWTEFVLRHPNMTFMRSPSLDQSFAVRHSWDVLAFFFAFIFLLVLIGLTMSKKFEKEVKENEKGIKFENINKKLRVCLIKSESGGITTLVTGPKTDSSYSYGIFQINSSKWCTRGRTGGVCNKRCEDFANDDIGDDIQCASLIYDREGFEEWKGWTKKCKGKTLPDLSQC
ncbi:hypothetical protein DMENIID0001_157460 [Sergentomyia squamirostris]